ncbi:MAG: RrF2 family transcriptional regulator [Candidatus Anammoxibacter sp.]
MKLTKATDYALILLKHLNQLEKGKTTSVKKVAEACHIPKRFLANIVHRLSKAGILVTVKGMDGGIRLSKSGDKITIKDVLEVLEGGIRFVECQTQSGICNTEDVCTIKHFWDAKLANFVSTLNNTTIKDLSDFMPQEVEAASSGK